MFQQSTTLLAKEFKLKFDSTSGLTILKWCPLVRVASDNLKKELKSKSTNP